MNGWMFFCFVLFVLLVVLIGLVGWFGLVVSLGLVAGLIDLPGWLVWVNWLGCLLPLERARLTGYPILMKKQADAACGFNCS